MINPSEFKEGEMAAVLSKLRDYDTNKDHLKELLSNYFREFDEDNNGFLDRKELRHFLIKFFATYHLHVPMTDEFVDSVFRSIDVNHDNKVELAELLPYSEHFVKELIAAFEKYVPAGEETKESH